MQHPAGRTAPSEGRLTAHGACRPVAMAAWGALLLLGWSNASALDRSCAEVQKAGQAALAQSRMHAAIDAPLDPDAARMGFKKTLMHSIVIGQDQYSNALQPSFRKTSLTTPDARVLASDVGAFMVEQGCQATGSEPLAGRQALVFTANTDLGRGAVRLKFWIDKSTGLPLRMVSDEPAAGDAEVDAALQALGQKKRPVATSTSSKPKQEAMPRVVATHAYVFGDVVQPPLNGAVPPAALNALQALLK